MTRADYYETINNCRLRFSCKQQPCRQSGIRKVNMKKLLYLLIGAIFLFIGCTEGLKVKKTFQKQESFFPLNEYERDFVFPPILGPLTLTDKTNYEKTTPGLGYSTKYKDNIAALEIYVYDLQFKSIPDDMNSPVVLGAFREAAGDIFANGRKHLYKQLTYSEARTVTLSGKDMLIINFEFSLDNVDRFAVLMFTVHNGKYFKVWLTIEKKKDPGYVDDSIRLIEEVTLDMLLGDTVQKYQIEF
jgi:hypothetical protein